MSVFNTEPLFGGELVQDTRYRGPVYPRPTPAPIPRPITDVYPNWLSNLQQIEGGATPNFDVGFDPVFGGGDSSGQSQGASQGLGGLGVTSQGIGQAAGIAGQAAGLAGVPNASAVATGIRGMGELAIDGQVSPATVAAALGQVAGRAAGPVAGITANTLGRAAMGLPVDGRAIAAQAINAAIATVNPGLAVALGLLGVTNGLVNNTLGIAEYGLQGWAQQNTLNDSKARDGIFGLLDGLNVVDYNDYDQGRAMQQGINQGMIDGRANMSIDDAVAEALGWGTSPAGGVESSSGNAPAGGMSGEDSGDTGPGDGYGGGV